MLISTDDDGLKIKKTHKKHRLSVCVLRVGMKKGASKDRRRTPAY